MHQILEERKGATPLIEVATGRYAGRTAAERQAERRRRLLDTAFDAIAEGGVASLRVRALCARAGLNDRYFYESFTDCDQLLETLVDEYTSDGYLALTTALAAAPSDLPGAVRACVVAAIDYVATNPRRGRLFIDLPTTPALRARRDNITAMLADLMLAQGRKIVGDEAATGIHAELATLTVVNGEFDLVVQWLRGDVDVEREEFIDFLTAMILTSAGITATVARDLPPRR